MKTKKVILITGASSGIGKDAALHLLQEGHIVYGAARRVEAMDDLVKAGGFALKMDVTNEVQINHAVSQILKEQIKIDVLINNAGFGLYGAVEDIPLDDARYQYEVNIFGLAAVTKAVLPSMRKHRSGTIINISSMGGRMYTPLGAWYHSTKHALEGWSDCLRVDLKQFGIHVVVVQPGIIATEFGDVLMDPLLKYSGNSVYSDYAKSFAKATNDNYSKPGASSPTSVISKVLSKAVNAKKTKNTLCGWQISSASYISSKIFWRSHF